MEEHLEMAKCQGVVTKDGGQVKLQRQYGKRRKPGKKEKTKERGNQPDAKMMHTYGQKKNATKRAVDKARRDTEADMNSMLDEDDGKKMIYKNGPRQG